MRDILFRGKTKDGRWVYGSYLHPTMHWHRFGVHRSWIVDAMQNGGYLNLTARAAVIDNTVGQYTGIDDANGQKIYEGDIVRFTRIDALGWIRERTGVVKYYSELPVFYILASTGDAWDWVDCGDLRVIGNIHDNPELMEAEHGESESE